LACFQIPAAIAPILAGTLYAAQDFVFVRNVSFVNLAVFALLASAGYVLEHVVMVQVAGSVSDLIMSGACFWRLSGMRLASGGPSRKATAGPRDGQVVAATASDGGGVSTRLLENS
jgi:hypothetical protein